MSDCPIVSTQLGQVSGFALAKAKCPEAQQVYGYLGIPFAKPPVGELRFKPPQSAEPWMGVRDGSKYPPASMQSTYFVELIENFVANYRVADEDPRYFDEDCLYLNVFTPKPRSDAKMPLSSYLLNAAPLFSAGETFSKIEALYIYMSPSDKTQLYPTQVLFWIHGGGFSFGSSVGYHGQSLCGLQDVVLVVPQYRLNAFGFLSLGKESSCPGNMGLLDQIKAMEWTKDNILAFGGDPNNVTLFGLSAGGWSVSSHVLSPMSRGLFHRAISHSGCANFAMAIKENTDVSNGHLFNQLGIKDKDPEVILEKLRSLSAKELIEAQEESVKNYDNTFQKLVDFTPVVDGKVFPKHPRDLIAGGSFAPVPYIIGCTNTETCGCMAERFSEGFTTGLTEEQATELIKITLRHTDIIPTHRLDEGVGIVKKEIMKTICPDDKYKWSKLASTVSADLIFLVPSVEQAIAHSDAGHPTYFYYMTQQLRMHHDEAYSKAMTKKPVFCEADHADDTVFTFGVPFGNGPVAKDMKFTEDERNLSKQWMSFIRNFAKTGNPNGIETVAKWPSYKSSDQRHLVFKMPFDEGKNVMGERYKFWKNLMAMLSTEGQ